MLNVGGTYIHIDQLLFLSMTKALKIKEKISKNKNEHLVFFYLVSDQVIYSLLFTLHIQLSHPCMTTGKTTALTRQTFVGKVMSLFFNMLSRLVITFLPRSKCLFISWLQLPCAFLEPPKIKSATVYTVSPSICHQVVGLDAMILVFWMLSFKPTFSLSFHFYQEDL